MRLKVEVNPVEFECEEEQLLLSDEALKEWIWQHHANDILSSIRITRKYSLADVTTVKPTDYYSSTLTCGTGFDQNRRLELLDTIAQVQRVFLNTMSLSDAFGCLLNGLLSLVDSEFGFIGETKYTNDGSMYLQIHSRASFSMDPSIRVFFERRQNEEVNLYNLHSLFGECLLTKRPVLSNDVKMDSRAGGVPPGHPVMNRFLGVPIFKHHGEIVGVVGVANKGGEGYTDADIELLGPFVLTCSSVIQAYRQINLINDLEEKVKERTLSLQQANQELEQANKRVMEASASQLHYFACMSHEIRTPLNCIIGLSSLVYDSGLNPMQHDAVRMIIQSGDLLLTVVNDVLDYSKLESGNVEIKIQRSSLQETMDAVVHSIDTKAQQKKICLRTLYDVALPEFLNTDSRRVQQILYNLLGNAIKFSTEGAVVDLHVGLSDGTAPPNSYSPSPFESDNGWLQFVRFTVRDYAKGIASGDFMRIFEPFRQATYETEQVYGGTGLGLAITTKLVHILGGHIHVDSVEGQWARFTVDLPYDGPVIDPVKLAPNLQNATVFLICDEDDVVSHVGCTLTSCRISYKHFVSSNEMESTLRHEEILDGAQTCVFLAQEDLFSDKAFDLLDELSRKTVLLTFGPRFQISKSHGHFRSLVQVIPSFLVKSIESHLVSQIDDSQLSNPRSSFASITSSQAVRYQEYSILVAEDNSINQKVLVRMLQRLGIKDIDVVENGKLAVEAGTRKKYDVILMDMQMPVMNGLEACKLITSLETGHRQASVVFVTAHVSSSFEKKCAKAGGSGFLPKPFNLSEIENCLQSMYLLRDGRHGKIVSQEYDEKEIEMSESLDYMT